MTHCTASRALPENTEMNWIEMINTERRLFQNGKCPECQTQLSRIAIGFWRKRIHYSYPYCSQCETEYYIPWKGVCGEHLLPDPYTSIPTIGAKELIELISMSVTP